jgi:pimeloyl-ACP methyl ester carboxylesterase
MCVAACLTSWRGAGVALSVAMHLRPMSKDTATPRTMQTGRSTSNSPQMTRLRCSNLHVDQADILGFGSGGTIAFQVAIRHPRMVHKLVIASGFLSRDGGWPAFWSGFAHARLQVPRCRHCVCLQLLGTKQLCLMLPIGCPRLLHALFVHSRFGHPPRNRAAKRNSGSPRRGHRLQGGRGSHRPQGQAGAFPLLTSITEHLRF